MDDEGLQKRRAAPGWGWVLAGVALCLYVWTGAAWGQSVKVFPTGAAVAVTQSTAVRLTWVLRDSMPGQARSPQGLFRANSDCTGEILGTISTPLRGTVASGGGRVPETLLIQQDVTRRAQARGHVQFFYCRTYTLPSGTMATANVTCLPGGSAFANFSIARVEIVFQNQRREITVPLDTPDLTVYADIRYNGTGALKAQWAVAEPGMADTAGFRVLETIQEFVPFGDRIVIQRPRVPPLPTHIPGEYQVALQILEPAAGFELPVARYFVEAREHPQRAHLIRLVEPAAGARVPLGNIKFRWEEVPGIAQYRLEVAEAEPLPAPGIASRLLEGMPTPSRTTPTPQSHVAGQLTLPGPPVLVALTPADTPVYQPQANQRQKLRPGVLYAWRILALDTRGQVVGASALHQFTYGEVR